ncbi:DUF4389 domain-containing protein [Arthrobacter sp. CG_A4]|uniref:DUF4389 domain-containing protein n=1 Tax=Arthrobacter sp. CG_A4 TaxID=3071706 RepID=UPI002DFB729F|nr:hypothetical protein [Arthrobacter sp. CG_A4]
MRPGRIVMLILGTLSALIGLGLMAGAGATGWANYQQRDNGYFTSPLERYSSDSYALASPRLSIMTQGGLSDSVSVDVAGSVLLRGSADAGKEIFIGIAPRNAVAAYLAEVKHSEITEVQFSPFRAVYRDVPGTRTPTRPADQSFWTAKATGPGTQQLTWDIRPGSWAVVVMNADASTPVDVNLQAGARSDLLWPVFVGLLVGGIVFLLIGIPLIILGAAGLGRGKGGPPSVFRAPAQAYGAHAAPVPAGQAYGGQPPAGQSHAEPVPAGYAYGGQPPAWAPPGTGRVVYPARLSGYLDRDLSRWMWLFKWFLAIPHFIVLFFLWFAFGVVTIVAWFAILFTGRYPRSLFNFNVGVIRWSWRVAFYSYGALGTDRYPPFTLERTDYPADFDVDYPEKLSRGLVLVKSWLLAIPHLLIIALLTGTAQTWIYRDGQWVQVGVGISLLGLLVVIAGVILLFTGVYARGLFDFLLGLNRWVYRVTTYVALMRDEYPPFHLDMGPRDPGDTPVGPYGGPPAGSGYSQVPGIPDSAPPLHGQPGPVGTGPATTGLATTGPATTGPADGRTGFYGVGGPAAGGPDATGTAATGTAANGPAAIRPDAQSTPNIPDNPDNPTRV